MSHPTQGRRGAAQVCREAGARVTTNVFVRDMDLTALDVIDSRRFEVVVDGLTAFRGAQLAIDTTLVSALRRDGTSWRCCKSWCCVGSSSQAEKARTHPELTGKGEQSPLGCLGCGGQMQTVGPDCSIPCRLVQRQSGDSARAPPSVEAAWLRRWSAMLACSAAKAFTHSLLGRQARGVRRHFSPRTGQGTAVLANQIPCHNCLLCQQNASTK